jgi:hypothetical protein
MQWAYIKEETVTYKKQVEVEACPALEKLKVPT